jgi:hypothetical protein
MIETRIKVIQPSEDISKDVYFEDKTKWTLTKSSVQLVNNSAIVNKDLVLKTGIKSASNFAQAVATGVTLDPNKTYVIQIKINAKNINRGKFTICDVDFTNLGIGKEMTRKIKPLTTSLKFRLECNNPVTGVSPYQYLGANDNITIDYFKIIEYDVSYLDLLKTEPVLYQSNVKDIYEPDKIKSDYTKDFDLPGTKNNNMFFNHWYKVSALGDFDSGARTPVIIQKRETDLIEGYMILNSVKLDSSQITYNVSVIAEMSNIWNDIDTLKLSDLDLSEYNHEMNLSKLYVDLPQNGTVASPSSLNPSAVNTVWTYETQKSGLAQVLLLPNGSTRLQINITGHGYTEGDFIEVVNYKSGLVFPPLEGHCVVEGVLSADSFYVNGIEPGPSVPPTQPFYTRKKNYTGNGWFYGVINRGHTTKNEMIPTKSKPSLFVKGLVDKIFKSAGYEYESEFLNTNYFKSLCVDILTKELTQTSDNMGNQVCEVKSLYTDLVNPQLGTTDNAFFLRYSKALNGPDPTSKFPKIVNSDAATPYGKEFTYDLNFNTEITDSSDLYGNGRFYPKYNGDYSISIKLTVGIAIQNPVSITQHILPKDQVFKQTSHWPGIDADLDGTPASTNLYSYPPADADGNSGMVVKLQILDSSDKIVWTSARSLITPTARNVSGYKYMEAVTDLNQTVALPMKKGENYRIRLVYTRNHLLCMGSEGSKDSKYRWGVYTWENFPLGAGTYYTGKDSKSPSSFNPYGWSVFLVGNNQTYKKKLNDSTVSITGLNWCKFELLQSVAEGSDIIAKNFVADMEQKDFLTSINKMFNLYWYWDRNKRKYIIEPFYNFYKQDEVDWTYRVAIDRTIEMKPLDNDKKYILKYKEGGDYYSKDYANAFGNGYGDSIVVNSSDVATNENKIECGFSLGVLVQFPTKPLNSMIMPAYTNDALSTANSSNSDNSENIRIYICSGLKYSSTPMVLDDGNAKVTQKYEGVKYNKYPFIGHIDDTYAPYYDLCFANPAQFSYTAKNYTTHNLYNKFWRDWFNLILNKEQKLVSYYMNLNDTDIFNLDYSKRYVINKEPFRLISVSDHNLTANNLALVTFVKDITSKQFKPKTITNAGGNKPWWRDQETGTYTESPWSTSNPWNFGVAEQWNPSGFQYMAVSSFTQQSNMFSSDTSVTLPQSTYERGLNNGASVTFDSVSLGTYNNDYGTENFVTGNNNRVYSSNNFVSGTNNEITAQNVVVMGHNIRASRPGIYFENTYISPEGVVHNATNVINGGQGTTTGYYETVNNLYKPNVVGLISGTGSPTNRYAGVLEIDNPNIPFTKLNGYDIRYDATRSY